ncbi:hypothetical protein RFI_01179 [Reticulomyxa filosa]|uniref:Uncharacterized protein n=1 Tax=Reticulomyxa filosa TaxID=46433 RepID=X6PBL7_RETFI|nr:hypothetical protein RFI_01179 [Reticulomyxa filosa]|eukprot:ETO35885.1 hypothetical protein RFI_01179 [Reticulomyxa filosa]
MFKLSFIWSYSFFFFSKGKSTRKIAMPHVDGLKLILSSRTYSVDPNGDEKYLDLKNVIVFHYLKDLMLHLPSSFLKHKFSCWLRDSTQENDDTIHGNKSDPTQPLTKPLNLAILTTRQERSHDDAADNFLLMKQKLLYGTHRRSSKPNVDSHATDNGREAKETQTSKGFRSIKTSKWLPAFARKKKKSGKHNDK